MAASKLDARGRGIVRRLANGAVVDLLLTTASPPTPVERAALERLGVTIRSVAGPVLSARVRREAIAALEEEPFIERLEVARGYSLE